MNSADKQAFENFLLAEYHHISQAYFAMHTAISGFFKNYLLMVGAPLSIIPIALKLVGDEGKASLIAHIKNHGGIMILGSLVVAGIGVCMMLHIITLRNESLLYARTCNGVRNYFYDLAALGPAVENSFRVLPTLVTKPRYFRGNFVPTIFAFGLLNGSYPAIAIYLANAIQWPLAPRAELAYNAQLIIIISLLVHLGIYALKTREKSNI